MLILNFDNHFSRIKSVLFHSIGRFDKVYGVKMQNIG